MRQFVAENAISAKIVEITLKSHMIGHSCPRCCSYCDFGNKSRDDSHARSAGGKIVVGDVKILCLRCWKLEFEALHDVAKQ